MANVQSQFQQFHTAIAITRKAEKQTLAEKREIVLDKLSEGIKKQREAGEEIPSYDHINQGSYAMETGVKPVDGDYDLDVALRFDLDTKDYPDPVVVKSWVYKALDGHTKEVRFREPCVTVFYERKGEHVYHLDFAIYAVASQSGSKFLARGKAQSSDGNRYWEVADPKMLLEVMKAKFSDNQTDRAQFRRTIKYLKRWKDVNFRSTGNAAPTGIALTSCALSWFIPVKTTDHVQGSTSYNDLSATLSLVEGMLRQFMDTFDSETGAVVPRLVTQLRVPPGNDLFEKMTSTQMMAFHERLQALCDALKEARDEVDPHDACKKLRSVFGDDFSVPKKEEIADARGPAIVSSGNSA